MVSAANLDGEQIYRQQCARCHGDRGQGVTKEYGKPLVGDRSVAELAKIIDRTMPEDAPQKCVGDDARKVAAFIYERFYGPIAQERNRPARVELARLTVRQHQYTICDLLASFRGAQQWREPSGLKAEYFNKGNFQTKERMLERVDPGVTFDFGEGSPFDEKIGRDSFSIRWQGGVLAPETGEYEFILDSENAARLWVDGDARPLIDALVRSGDDTEHRETIFLLAGEVYPLRLELQKSEKAKDKTASIELRWKPPQRAEEIIPAQALSPHWYPQRFVLSTRFPPDDRSTGYERGNSISQAWEKAATDAALETAEHVIAQLDDYAGIRNKKGDRNKLLREFAERWVTRAFRRPLTDEQKQFFVDRPFKESPDAETAVKRVVLLSLVSPRFLYQDLPQERHDSYAVACRLSYAVWDSLPDDTLLSAAAQGHLTNPDSVRWHAARMMNDPRAQAKLRAFLDQWLNVDRFVDLAKDARRYPDFDRETVDDLRTALDLFVNDILSSSTADFRELLLARWLYLNGRLGSLYGARLPPDAPFQKVTFDDPQRAGVLTHPYLMAGLAYTATSSPIHRGVFVARSVLGRALRPPPEAVAPLPVDLHQDLTTRQRVALQTNAQACQACHRMINPLGFAFEHFDAVGRYREIELGKPIDAGGVYQTKRGDKVTFRNVRELAEYLATSDETHEAFVEQLFHYLVKQPIRAFGAQQISQLRQRFVDQDCNIRKLAIEIAVIAATSSKAYDLAVHSQATP
ncbi:MAG TPA: DUF1592 domain-containing protein [Pirellulales bacterium]|nr:DUF1592 domain-containing protein [Pirellulales bacterium]